MDIASALPLVSIGMPVYNGARHLRQALDSLLGQTFGDFELIVSDNGSTDGTDRILSEYARREGRMRCLRQARNLGAAPNWNAVLREARASYFKWASANDWCAPTFLARCLEALEKDPGAVLCYGRTELVDEDGRRLEAYPYDLAVPDASPSARYARVREKLMLNNPQQALVRRDALLRTARERPYPGGDIALTAELALQGRFLLLEKTLLHRRIGRDACAYLRSPLEIQRLYDPRALRPMRLRRLRLHLDFLRSIARAPIPLPEKARALRIALRHAVWDRESLGREIRSLLPTHAGMEPAPSAEVQ